MNRARDCYHCEDPCSTIIANGMDVCVDYNNCKIQADITVERVRNILIRGIVTDCTNTPVSGALVKLLRYRNNSCDADLQDVCHTYTDCQGNYKFDLDQDCKGKYRVLVSQCIRGTQCHTDRCDPPPCNSYEPPRTCRNTSSNSIRYY